MNDVIKHAFLDYGFVKKVRGFHEASDKQNQSFMRSNRSALLGIYESPILTVPLVIIQHSLFKFLKNSFDFWPKNYPIPLKSVCKNQFFID